MAVLAAFTGHSLAPVTSSAQTVPGTIQTVITSAAPVAVGLVPASSDDDQASTAPTVSALPPASAPQSNAAPIDTLSTAIDQGSQAAQTVLQPQGGDFGWVNLAAAALAFASASLFLWCAAGGAGCA